MIWVDKVHHQKAHQILYKKKCIVNLSKFFLGIAKILQEYYFNRYTIRCSSFFGFNELSY